MSEIIRQGPRNRPTPYCSLYTGPDANAGPKRQGVAPPVKRGPVDKLLLAFPEGDVIHVRGSGDSIHRGLARAVEQGLVTKTPEQGVFEIPGHRLELTTAGRARRQELL